MRSYVGIALWVVGVIVFTLYLQTNATLCDGLGFPICTGSP